MSKQVNDLYQSGKGSKTSKPHGQPYPQMKEM